MSDNTHIQWSDATWNPIRARDNATGKVGWHCEVVSDGCKNCYAQDMNLHRFGTGHRYQLASRDQVSIFLDEKTLLQPLHWKKPRRIFVCSMTDLFGEWVPFEWIDKIFAVAALCPQHKFQILTKRPERMEEYLATRRQRSWYEVGLSKRLQDQLNMAVGHWITPPKHIWLGTSVDNQDQAVKRIPHLLRCPAAVRFLSCEPLLGEIDLGWVGASDELTGCADDNPFELGFINWVIIGGESGPKARPTTIGHIRSLVRQCQGAGVSCFVKQLGARPIYGSKNADARPPLGMKDPKGGDMNEWPADLRVREFPNV